MSRLVAALAWSVARPAHVAAGGLAGGLALSALAPPVLLLIVVAVVLAGATATAARRAQLHGPRPADPLATGTQEGLRLSRVLRACTVLAVGLALGTGLGEARRAALEHTTLLADGHGAADGRVSVTQPPRRSQFGGWSAAARYAGEPVLLRISDDRVPLPDTGAVLAVRGRLSPPGDFARSRGAHAELRADTGTVVGTRGGVPGAVDAIRRRAQAALDHGLPPAASGLLQGMVLGQDAALPDDVRDDFRAAGLSHLVAASGTNVVLLAALAAGLATLLGLGLTARLWLVLALIALYVPLAGAGPSIQRAGVMGAAVAVAGLAGRPAARWYALLVAAVVTLALDPRAVADPGWQLSFAAVVGIAILTGAWAEGLARLGVPRAAAEVLAMTFAATLSTAPVVAAHFGTGSAWAVPVNALAAPVVAPIMWLGATAAALGQLTVVSPFATLLTTPLCAGLDAVAGFGTGYLAWLAAQAADLPGAVLPVGPALAAGACAALVGLSRSGRARRALPVGALGLAWAAVGLKEAPAAVPPPAPGVLRVTLVDVGQGDATLVQQGGASVLVDTGPPEGDVVAGLRRQGVRRLDLLVVTHAELDHAGGAAAVLDAVPVGTFLDGRDDQRRPEALAAEAAARAKGVRVVRPATGQLLRLDGGLVLRVLWPRPEAPARHAGGDPNERAIVLEADGAAGGRVLLTADAESDVLLRLPLRPVDVLKVSHHGSADEGLPLVLRRTRPQIAGIEVGRGNTYGHPAPPTLAALRAARVPAVLRTDRDGDVRLDRAPDGRWTVRIAGPR